MAGLAAALAGCVSAPAPPFEPPPLESRLSYFEGSIRSGPIAQSNPAPRSIDEALWIEFTVAFVEHLPQEQLTPVPERTELVLVARGSELLRPTSELGRGARVGIGESARLMRQKLAAGEFGRTAPAAHGLGALSRGVTGVFSVQFPEELRIPGEGTARRRVALQIARAPALASEELSVALVVEDLTALDSEAQESLSGSEKAASGSRVLQREYVLLTDRPTIDGPPLALSLRAPAFGADAGFALWIDVRSSRSLQSRADLHASAFAAAELELVRAGVQTSALAGELPQSDLYRREIGGVFEALDLQRYHRSALVFLAGSTGARLAQDLALVAEDAELSAYVKTVIEQSQGREVLISDAAGVGWLLERSAYLFAASQMDAHGLPGELRACVLAHAGEAGRSSGGLQSAVAESADLTRFAERLVDDNWISLVDAQPAARVRAFDWLRKRGKAPAGFDPLGTREERRAGLQIALDAKEGRAPVR